MIDVQKSYSLYFENIISRDAPKVLFGIFRKYVSLLSWYITIFFSCPSPLSISANEIFKLKKHCSTLIILKNN